MQDMSFRELRELNAMSVEDAASLMGVTVKTIYRWEKGEVHPKEHCLEILRNKLAHKQSPQKDNHEFTFIDLFAGIGGIRKGFEAINGKCVFTSEWDQYAQRTYRANFHDDHHIAGDITKVEAQDIPAHDVLLAGFPCQPFSLAGVSKKNALGRAHGFEDKTQGTLFFDVLRIIKHHKPKAFLLENVKNLKSHNKGDTFATIVGALKAEGYTLSTRVIDGKGYVPQHRERIFIAGFKEDTGFNFDNLEFADPKTGPILETILHDEGEEAEAEYTLPVTGQGSNAASRVNDKYTLTDKLWAYLQAYAAKHKAAGNGFGYGLNGPEDKARTLSARYHKDGSEILIKQDGKNPRRLTPRECARLMGYDMSKTPEMIIPVSDTRAYQQFGNSVVVPVIEEIAKYMKSHILELVAKQKEEDKLLQMAAE
ncbi:DNA (cytosine-5-)-methyltransferase [Kordiimonas laminariae]|uniref:DNA (cytosine-5-)-methyltransferase n=1 Tax=Kordiimonas laminariae TaxID=2917717 RepID=UPI001FF3C390|nr:DNA (cytosine-5-)-methyltransferase [Kordiimonas laminariae]MCK0070860.1 DNA (cytosine-5-)-methyltransferase [Kordiimonas laminariae]